MRRTVTARTGGVGIDVSDFHGMVRDLRRARPELSRSLRRRLRRAGLLVAVHAREIAEQHSKRIPPTIKVRVAGATVSIVGGSEDVPIGPLFELGNTSRKSAAASERGVFRHPVYGNRDRWVNQDMHPYLAPAVLEHLPEVEREVAAALDDTARILIGEFGG